MCWGGGGSNIEPCAGGGSAMKDKAAFSIVLRGTVLPRTGLGTVSVIPWKKVLIPKVCFFYCSTERNSECRSETFLFGGIARIPSEKTICFVFSVFRGIIFSRKFSTLLTSVAFTRKPILFSTWQKTLHDYYFNLLTKSSCEISSLYELSKHCIVMLPLQNPLLCIAAPVLQ